MKTGYFIFYAQCDKLADWNYFATTDTRQQYSQTERLTQATLWK